MASLCARSIFRMTRSVVPSITSARTYMEDRLPDPLDLATGLEKKELLALQSGNDDPFLMKSIKRGVGTKDQPNIVPSFCESRIVGCVCEEDSTCILWMWVHEGQPRRCECGHWFKLERREPL